jgi:hypothetical protein
MRKYYVVVFQRQDEIPLEVDQSKFEASVEWRALGSMMGVPEGGS